jgi:hypothetical protein
MLQFLGLKTPQADLMSLLIRLLAISLIFNSFSSIAHAGQGDLLECKDLYGSDHVMKMKITADLNEWIRFVELDTSLLYASDYLVRANFATIADLSKDAILESAEFLALCDRSGNLQALAVLTRKDNIVFERLESSLALGKGAYVDLLISAPLAFPGRVKAGGLEVLARVYQSLEGARSVIKLDNTPYSQSFYERFGFEYGVGRSMFSYKYKFMAAYKTYLNQCLL